MFFRTHDDLDVTLAAIDRLRRRMDRAFDDLGEGAEPREAQTFTDQGDQLTLDLDVPGVATGDVQLSVHQDVLTVKGERKSDAPEGFHVHRQERRAAKFAQSFALPCRVDPERCTASLKNGVLTLSLTKAADARPRQIAVRAS